MKVFISWSKSLSHGYASAFRDWLPNVIQSAEAFISSQDIGLGQRGIEKIESRLNEYSFGILFVSDENREQPWLLYEAGALSRSINEAEARVIPFLIDVDRSKLAGSPLSHFQNAQSVSRDNVKLLCSAINEACEDPLDADRFERAFSKWWPDLEEAFERIELPKTRQQEVTLESLSEAISQMSGAVVELRNRERQQSLLLEGLVENQVSLSKSAYTNHHFRLDRHLKSEGETEAPRLAISEALADTLRRNFNSEEERREFNILLDTISSCQKSKKAGKPE